jgi:hypothetical protein
MLLSPQSMYLWEKTLYQAETHWYFTALSARLYNIGLHGAEATLPKVQ